MENDHHWDVQQGALEEMNEDVNRMSIDEEKIDNVMALMTAHLLLLMCVIFLALLGFALVDNEYYALAIIVGVFIALLCRAGTIIYNVEKNLEDN